MEPTTFFEHYRICSGEDSREVSRTGAAINYKAIDTRSHDPVRLQLIPKATIDPEKLAALKERAETTEKLDHVNIAKTFAVGIENDYFAIVSEYFEGQTVDSWIVENGPMPADAALRAGLQVVRALGEAAFFNLTHRAIQPSNLMIVSGESPSGGWPFVKLLNFGLAGLELHSESNEAPEIAPSILPQFASPEQRAGGEINFESEMYSLGATICFLLTGAAPLAISGMKARLRIRRLPELRRAPKPLHDLLVSLLRENPDNRPHDPVALEKQMLDCLTKIERRQAFGRKLGLSLASVVARKPKVERPASPFAQVVRALVAVIVVLLVGSAAAEFLFHDKIPYLRRTQKVGVPIGVPDAAKFAVTPNAAPAAGNQPIESSPAPVVADANLKKQPPSEPNETNNSAVSASPTQTATNQIALMGKQSEPTSPAIGPEEQGQTTAPDSDQSASNEPNESSDSTTPTKKKSIASSRRSNADGPRTTHSYSNEDNDDRENSHGRGRARIIGRTPDGRPVVKLTSGQVVILPRHYDDNGIHRSRPRRRIYSEGQDDFVPPAQPFYPNN